MRFTIFLLCVSFFQTIANNAYSQKTRLSLDAANTKLVNVLDEIEELSGFYFLYNEKLVDTEREISISVKNQKIEEILNQIFKGTNVRYTITDRKIILMPGCLNNNNAQQKSISGIITDESSHPLPGVTVVIKGTTQGTITDVNGKYILTNVPANAVVQFSFVGMKTQKITFTGQNTIDVIMLADAIGLEEIVAVGYGTTARKNFTGSVAKVDMDNSPVALAPRTDAMDALRGTVAGMTVSQQQGAGQSPSILVRGQKSVDSKATSPLIVLDGVIFMGAMRDIDPSSIDNISVLKDATSAAAYGSRAANGVIMITTKKGKKGKPVINFKTSVGVSNVINKADVLSPSQWIKKVNLLQGLDENADPTSWMSEFETENYKSGQTVDWQDLVERNGLAQNYSVSMSGANKNVNYYMSAAYANTEGVLIGDDYSRTALTSRLTTNITDWLEIGGNVNYSFNDYSGPTTYDIYQAIRLTPYGRAYRDEKNGLLEKYPATEGIYRTNPLWDIKSGTIDDHDVYYTTVLTGHALVKVPWVKGLSFRLNYSYTNRQIERDYFTHEGYYIEEGTSDERYSADAISDYLTSANGYSKHTKDVAWVWDNIINYTRQFGKHFVNFTAVYTRDSYKKYYKEITGSDFSGLGNTELGYNGLTYAAIQKIPKIENTKKNNIGYLCRLNYNYETKYHLTASIRRDGSSVFGADNKWGIFPSVGLGWTVSQEDFMKNLTVIDYLKWKISWGKNGNQSLDPYETLSSLALGQSGKYSYPFGNTSEVSWGQRISDLGNSDLGWEETSAFNTGFEIAMFEKKVNLDMNAYWSKTTNQIFDRNIPVMANGITTIKATMGQVNNWGIEANLHTNNISCPNFSWSSSITYYINRNKLKELYGDGSDDVTNSLFLGKSLGAIYGYKSIGIVQEDDKDYIEANGAVAGDVKFWDKTGDGTITSDDRTILGYSKENFRMSFSNTLTYKNFELYLLFSGIFGGNKYYRSENLYAYRTTSDVIFDNNFNHGWWTAENKSNKYPRVGYTDSRYIPVQNRAFVRLQNISLSYTFKQPWVRQLKINNLEAYVAATNLFTITGWDGGDPETGQTIASSGYKYGYPLSSTFTMGINLTF